MKKENVMALTKAQEGPLYVAIDTRYVAESVVPITCCDTN